MPFNQLLCKCLLTDQTSVREEGISARLVKQSGECVLAFRLDSAEFRKAFRIENDRVCDHLFFYKRSSEDPILLCVELKGSALGRAADQIATVIRLLKKELAKLSVHFRAVIVSNGRVPRQFTETQKRFQREHQVKLWISRDGDLRRVLRD
jgi:hypothetical protein